MVPLYAARIEDLGSDDLVQVECSCGHAIVLRRENLATAGMKPYEKVLNLPAPDAVPGMRRAG